MYPETYISGLGLTALHRRTIRPGREYDRYFTAPRGSDPLLSQGASVYDTLDFMADIIEKTKGQTRAIAKVIQGNSFADTCRKLWNFCYGHIQYKQDSPGEEQLRSPNRTWADRKSGVDCDCFAIFCSSVLSNLGIAHALRICELKNKGYFQHVYVVVPTDQRDGNLRGGYITIDPVLDRFNQEAPGITKTHDKMIPVRFLNGVESAGTGALLGTEFSGFSGLGCACDTAGQVADKFVSACASHLRNTRNVITAAPERVCGLYNVNGLVGAIDYALQYESDPEAFGEALAEVAQREAGFFLMHLGGLEEDLLGFDGLGKGIFSKMSAGVKNVVAKAKDAAQNVGEKAKETAQKAVEVAKKAGEKVIQYNPLSIAARAGFLVAMEINMFGIADQIRWGYATADQLRKYGVSDQDASKARTALAKVEDMFVNVLKGQKDSLKKAILSGKQAINGLGSGIAGALGEPATAAATTSAAMAFILKAKDWISGMKIVPKVKELINQNPGLVQNAKDKILDKAFGPKKQTVPTPDGKQIVETPPAQQSPGANYVAPPSAAETVQIPNLPTDLPGTDIPSGLPGSDLPTVDPVNIVPQNPVAPQGPPPDEKKGGNTGLIIGVGLGLAALAFAASGSGKKSKSLSGPGTSKRKTKRNSKRKTSAKPGKRTTKRTTKPAAKPGKTAKGKGKYTINIK